MRFDQSKYLYHKDGVWSLLQNQLINDLVQWVESFQHPLQNYPLCFHVNLLIHIVHGTKDKW